MTSLLLASRSTDKLREIRELVAATGFRIISLDEAGFMSTSEEEDIEIFDTFLENARAKAEWFGRKAAMTTLADDSGICVDALSGAPGVLSRRFSGRTDLVGRALDEENNRMLLARLAGRADADRGAAYVCAAVIRRADGRMLESVGSVRGRILPEPAGKGGFGYDPLFLVPEMHRSFGEIPAELKHSLSHRARAIRGLIAQADAFLNAGRQRG